MQTAQSKLKEVVIEATITRADGRIEPQGIVSYWHQNPLKRLALQGLVRARRRATEKAGTIEKAGS